MNLLSAFNWYGFLIGAAMLICIFAAWALVKKRGYNPDIVFTVALICIPCAIIGARLYYVIFDIVGGGSTFEFWFNNSEGNFTLMRLIGFDSNGKFEGLSGLAIYGGLIAATLGAIIVRAINKGEKNPRNHMTYIQMLDAFFILIILGQAIGRWGNFANGEAYGNPVTNPDMQWFPYAVNINGSWFQATFFYESLLNFIGFGLMLWHWLSKRKSYDGFIFSFYCCWYGLGRLFIEGLRSDSLYTQGEFNIFIFITLIIAGIALATVYIVKEMRQAERKGKKFKPENLLLIAGILLFSLYCIIRGTAGLISAERLRISQLVSGLLVVWGTSNIIGHILKAKLTGKKIFIFTGESTLSLDYLGYDKSINYICSTYEKSGKLKSETEKFSYNSADGKDENTDEESNNLLGDAENGDKKSGGENAENGKNVKKQ